MTVRSARFPLLASLAFIASLLFASSEAHAAEWADAFVLRDAHADSPSTKPATRLQSSEDPLRRFDRPTFEPAQQPGFAQPGITADAIITIASAEHTNAPVHLPLARAPPVSR